MEKPHTQTILTVSGISLVLAIGGSCFLFWKAHSQQAVWQQWTQQLSTADLWQGNAAPPELTQQAQRLQTQLVKNNMQTPGVASLARAVQGRQALEQRALAITLVQKETGAAVYSGSILLSQHPTWVHDSGTAVSANFTVDPAMVERSLRQGEIAGLPLLQTSTVLSAQLDAKQVLRATADGIAKPGYDIDISSAAAHIADAFEKNIPSLTLQGTYSEPSVTVQKPDGSTQTLQLLATGLSDFAGSTPGRLWNVHKAIEQQIHNVMVKDGTVFSLVAALNAPITLGKGWKEDLGLFGGGAAMTPGAGICQSATTLYRAALLAGLPIVEKRNHSLYVSHYELFGIGLDATVFPNVHDFRFQNNTGGDLLIQAYTQGDTVIVHMFGKKDGRSVSLDGPYFFNSKKRPVALRALGRNEIGWVRTLTDADGSHQTQPLIATYAKPFPRSLTAKYGPRQSIKLLAEAVVPRNN